MPGGFGGTDIYMSDILDGGSFGTPINLGKIVNTEGNESFSVSIIYIWYRPSAKPETTFKVANFDKLLVIL